MSNKPAKSTKPTQTAASSSKAAAKTTAKPAKAPKLLSYEAYLDEVTTLIAEKFDLSDNAAISLVMKAQDAEFFSPHDDDPSMRTLDRAHQDSNTVFKMKDGFK